MKRSFRWHLFLSFEMSYLAVYPDKNNIGMLFCWLIVVYKKDKAIFQKRWKNDRKVTKRNGVSPNPQNEISCIKYLNLSEKIATLNNMKISLELQLLSISLEDRFANTMTFLACLLHV